MRLKTVLICFLVISSSVVSGQLCFPVKRVYAFVQPVTRGTAAKEESRDRSQGANHLVYIVSKNSGLQLNHVWINGALHAAALKEVSSPVVLYNRLQDSAVLVPKSRHKTYQLAFTALPENASAVTLPVKYANAPILLEIQYKKKRKYFTVEQVKELAIMPLY